MGKGNLPLTITGSDPRTENAAFEAVKSQFGSSHRTTKSNQIFPPREKRFCKFTNWLWKDINISMPSDFRGSSIITSFAGMFVVNNYVEDGTKHQDEFRVNNPRPAG